MAKQLKVCKRCGMGGLVWKPMGIDPATGKAIFVVNGQPSLFIPDAAGNPATLHPCKQTAAAAAQQPAYQGSGPAFQPTPAAPNTAPDTEPSVAPAIDMSEQLADMEAALEAAAEAEQEAKRAIARTLAKPAYDVSVSSDHFVPAIDTEYLIDSAQYAAVKAVIDMATLTGEPQNIGVHGPAGSGKSSFGIQVGAIRQAPTFIIEAAAKESASDWYTETFHDENKRVVYRESRFVQGIETSGAVVVINDVALLQSRTVQNGLNELLDPTTRRTFVEKLGREVKVAKGVIIIATWNVGAEYTGASDLSLQIIDRLRAGCMFEMPYPDTATLTSIIRGRTSLSAADAKRLAKVVGWLREDSAPVEVSTRGLLAAAKLVEYGVNIGAALNYTIFGELDDEERSRVYGIIDVALGKESTLSDAERLKWAAPEAGKFVKLASVHSGIE